MKMTMKHGALAFALLGSAALFAGPTLANSLHDEGDFGGGYRIIGPGGSERHYYLRHHVFRPYDERPIYVRLWPGVELRLLRPTHLLRPQRVLAPTASAFRSRQTETLAERTLLCATRSR
jgi:hypothetical protein